SDDESGEREELEGKRKGRACYPSTQPRGKQVDARISANARALPHKQPDDDERHHDRRRYPDEIERERDRQIVALAEAMGARRPRQTHGRDRSRERAQHSRAPASASQG